MSLPSIVLAPIVGAYDLLGVGYRGRIVEALSECISDQGSRCGMMSTDPTMNVLQQLPSLFDGNATLQDPSVASLVELPLDNDERLGSACDPSGLCLVRREHFTEKPIEV